mmetsp:Transcript_24542/g.57175  ORF Transcript_24542/g.57175 Transcript_24542/m.57175 type:complete len:238 (+) Transcript_24542:718-1431(+)
MAINLGSKADWLSKPAGIARPVGTSVSNKFGAKFVNGSLEFVKSLWNCDKKGLQILRIIDLDILHHLLRQNVVQITNKQVSHFPALGVLHGGDLLGVSARELLQLLVNRRNTSGDQGDKLFQWSSVGVLCIVPRELLNVASGGNPTDREFIGFLSQEFNCSLFHLSDDTLDNSIRLDKFVAEIHQGVKSTNSQRWNLKLKHLCKRPLRASTRFLHLAVCLLWSSSSIGNSGDEVAHC